MELNIRSAFWTGLLSFLVFFAGCNGSAKTNDNSENGIDSADVAATAEESGADVILDEPPQGGSINGHEYVDLGLPSGLKWATCNIGAESPEEDGDSFAWGEISPKSEYVRLNYKFYEMKVCEDSLLMMKKIKKYNHKGEYGEADNKNVLEANDDAAYINWGGGWRMPTKADFEELMDCDWTLTTSNGMDVCLVTGFNGNSIVIPVGTSMVGLDSNRGVYWTSSLSDSEEYALYMYVCNNRPGITYNCRYFGLSVRPVHQ